MLFVIGSPRLGSTTPLPLGRNTHRNAFGRHVRSTCDVLLR
jgi:hypothetical protein